VTADERSGEDTARTAGATTVAPLRVPVGRAIRVVVVDDHEHIRNGLARLLADVPDVTLVGEAPDAVEGVRVCVDMKPDVVIMDLRLPRVDGVEATRRILARRPEIRVVVLTSFPNHRKIAQAVEAGAIGYVLKDDPPDAVVAAIRRAGGLAPAA
jgi:DNA-binding NarL/FixJ family response regulator